MNKIKKGDEVIVMTGKDKGRRGQVLKVFSSSKILVENINLVKFNRYFPWGFESRGLITANINMGGSASDLHISSNIEIDAPGFDKIYAKILKGQFEYKNNSNRHVQ